MIFSVLVDTYSSGLFAFSGYGVCHVRTSHNSSVFVLMCIGEYVCLFKSSVFQGFLVEDKNVITLSAIEPTCARITAVFY